MGVYDSFKTHPNRVSLEDLKVGDFFIVLDTDRLEDQYRYNHRSERVWLCGDSVKKHNEYSFSVFGRCVSLASHVMGLQTCFQYLWFGKDPIIIKLPKKQQTIYRNFFRSIEKNEDVAELGWSEWYRKNKG